MEIRVLRYFLAVAREENITAAAAYLHLSQPTLSRQIHDLELELGKQLLVRGSRKVTLTKEGKLLRKRAEEIITLADRTEKEIQAEDNEDIEGDIYIGAGESPGLHCITRPFYHIRKKYPRIQLHISSGDTKDVLYDLDNGLIDFGVVFYPLEDNQKYNFITFDYEQKWIVLMKKDNALAQKAILTWKDLENVPLIVSRNAYEENLINLNSDQMQIAATYSLAYNASIMVEDGIGIAPTFEGLIHTEGTNLCEVPMEGAPSHMSLIWKKYQTLSPQAALFLDEIEKENQSEE